MLQKIIRAIADGYRAFVEELEDELANPHSDDPLRSMDAETEGSQSA